MKIEIGSDVKVTRCANAAVAAQTDIDGSILDMQGFESVAFIALLGDVTDTCALELLVEHGDESDLSDAAESVATVTFTAGAADADNKLLIAEAFKPIKRYVRPVLKRGTANAVVDGIIGLQFGAANKPVTQGSTVLGSAFAVSPASE